MTSSKEKISMSQFFRMFPDDETARKQFEQWRWGDTKRCPHCDSVRISDTSQKMPYRCKDCRKRFSVRYNTVMAHSNLGYQQWMLAVYIATVGVKGTASTKLASDVGTSQTSAWYLGHRLRKAWETEGCPMSGIFEVDEAYFGGKEKNKHKHKKSNMGRGAVGKTAVVAVRNRDKNKIAAKVVKSTSKKELQDFISESVEPGSIVYTDDHRSYEGLDFEHETVKHLVGEYVREQAHINGVESFWALLKRGYYGTHHYMSPKHLHRYVNEFSARHSVRKMNTFDAMSVIARGMIGKELRFEELIK
ncbi:MAG: IS1595 family transposase [Acidiferrobacterales bacterium]|nr:IS1595 family transposase [Acidiferrobacterales bacterium]